MTNLSLSHCFLAVDDQDEALRFYTDVLGLEKRQDLDLGGVLRWITVGPAGQDIEIGLLRPGGPDSTPEDITQALDVVSKGLVPGVIFTVPDVEATFADLVSKGVTVDQKITDQPYGRDCAFRDPSGNHLRFTQLHTA